MSCCGSAARSISRVTRKSISSHTLSVPTDSGTQMDISAWGLKPSLYFSGVPARRKIRCTTCSRSRWLMYAALPVFSKRSLSLSIALYPLGQQALRSTGAAGGAAVRGELGLVGAVPLTQEQLPAHAHVHAAPGQALVLSPLACGI